VDALTYAFGTVVRTGRERDHYLKFVTSDGLVQSILVHTCVTEGKEREAKSAEKVDKVERKRDVTCLGKDLRDVVKKRYWNKTKDFKPMPAINEDTEPERVEQHDVKQYKCSFCEDRTPSRSSGEHKTPQG